MSTYDLSKDGIELALSQKLADVQDSCCEGDSIYTTANTDLYIGSISTPAVRCDGVRVYTMTSGSVIEAEATNYRRPITPEADQWILRHLKKYLSEKELEVLEIKLDNHVIAELPARLDNIATEIESARELLELEPDWDSYGAKKISKTTWKRAIVLLCNYAQAASANDIVLLTPDIAPVADGSIDLFWEDENGKVLINIPSSGNFASFYCLTTLGRSYKGDIDASELDGILLKLILDLHEKKED